MTVHDDALRLAAIEIDFPLSPGDERRLRDHLDACAACRREAYAFRATAGQLAALAVRPAPPRLRAVVSGAAAEARPGPFAPFAFLRPAGLPLGTGVLLLLALLLAAVLAAVAVVAGAPRSPFQAAVSSAPAIVPAEPVAGELSQLRSIPACSHPISLLASAGAVWFGCPDGTLWRATPSAGSATRVANAVLGVAAAATGVWAFGADGIRELDGTTGAQGPQVSGVQGSAGALAGDTLIVVDTTAGAVRWVELGTKTPSVVATTAVGREPVGIATGFGSAWVTLPGDGTVVRLDLATRRIAAVIAVGAGPRGVVIGRDRVWVADDADGSIASIDPTTNAATLLDVDRTSQGSLLPGIAVVPDGRVWVADARRSLLVQVDPSGAPATAIGLHGLTGDVGPIATLDGSVWVVDTGGQLDRGRMGAIDEFALPLAGN